jgi:hypothetical protein
VITPTDTPTPAVTAAPHPCPLRALAPVGFDWPCGCGHRSDQCTQKSDGTCDG